MNTPRKAMEWLFSNSLCSNENNLIYFLNQLDNKGKRKFCANIAVFSCNVLHRNTVRMFFHKYIYLYNLYPTITTYFGNSLWHVLSSWWQQLLGKTYGFRCQNGAMVSDSFAHRKTKSCRQHGLYILGLIFLE